MYKRWFWISDRTLQKSQPLLVEGIPRERTAVDKVSGLLYLPFKLHLRFDCALCDPYALCTIRRCQGNGVIACEKLFLIAKCKSMVLFFFL